MDELSFIYVGSNPWFIILKSRDVVVLDLILESLSWKNNFTFRKLPIYPRHLILYTSDKLQFSPVKSTKIDESDFLEVNLTFSVI